MPLLERLRIFVGMEKAKEFSLLVAGKCKQPFQLLHNLNYNESNQYVFFRKGKLFMWDSGSQLGEIIPHSKKNLSGSIRPVRPFRFAMGGLDFKVRELPLVKASKL